MPTVLITGARAPAALEWTRAFGEAGWRVVVADSMNRPVARFSRHAHAFVRTPSPVTDAQGWLRSLSDTIAREDVTLVLPTCEETFHLALHRDQLPRTVEVMVDTPERLDVLHNKARFAERSQAWPITAPPTQRLVSQRQVLDVWPHAADLVFKPAYSRFATQTLVRPSGTLLRDLHPTPVNPWVAQDFVDGMEHCTYSILREGRVVAHACYRPTYRVGYGAGIFFEPVDAPEVEAFVRAMGADTGHTGQLGFDLNQRPDGRWFVLECNPRATSGVHLFADQPQALVDALLGRRSDVQHPATSRPGMVGLAMLVFAAPDHLGQPTFWRDWWRARNVMGRPGDQRPRWAQLAGLMEMTGRAWFRRQGLLEASTTDIEWNGPLLPVPPQDSAKR